MLSAGRARRPVGVVAVAAALVCLVVAGLFWPERTAHAHRPATARLAAAEMQAEVQRGFSLVGHRGFPSRTVTENTRASFRRAVRYGATAVEMDVQLTRDGRLLVLHDPTLDRSTTCRGRVDQRTLRSILDRCRGRWGHEPLPSLASALDTVARLGTHVVVDVKRPPSAWTPTRYARLVDTIRSRGLVDRAVVLGFHRANLQAIHALEPGLHVEGIADDLAEVERMRTWADGINLPPSLATPDLVASLHEQGLLVIGRKTSVEGHWSRLRDAGTDGVLTDSVAAYRTWSARQG